MGHLIKWLKSGVNSGVDSDVTALTPNDVHRKSSVRSRVPVTSQVPVEAEGVGCFPSHRG